MVNNKKILKNTLLLYMRMFFLMALSLYTSRLFLEVLGVADFGIYNVVGGVIVLFSFLNNALSCATSRFINYHLGQKDYAKLQSVFASAITIHVIISGLVVLLGETVGLWFLNTQLNIPESRMIAANWVYQMSVLSTCIGIIGTPFDGVIIAHERMGFYAYLSILEAVLKLIILFILFYVDSDRLILYSALFLISGLIITAARWIYSVRNFKYCRFRLAFNKKEFLALGEFSGWSLFGQLANVGATTGLNMIVNIFYGVVLNAAFGVAQQINATIYKFVSNFQTAFNPQLVQTYSNGDMDDHRLLVSRATRISYYLLFVISLPILLNIDYILSIWLTNVPPYTAIFSQLIIVLSLLEALGTPLWMSMHAIGRIRVYQLIVSVLNFMTLPLAYVLLKSGYAPQYIFIAKIFIQLGIYIFRIYYILPKIDFSIQDYFKKDIGPIFIISLISSCVILGINRFIVSNVIMLVSDIFLSIVVNVAVIWLIGLSSQEKYYVSSMVMKKMRYE